MNEPSPADKKVQDALKSSGEIPKHVAIIMDGNGRWAEERRRPRTFGHREGVHSVRDIVEASGQLGIKYLTLYTFSTENWRRPKTEVAILMRLLIKSLRDETDKLHENNVRLVAVGDMLSLPKQVLHELKEAIEKTRNNKLMTLVLALSYSGRWDILNAVKKIASEYKKGDINLSNVNEKIFSDCLVTDGIPDPDLLIRTGGDYRISNFLLWESAYTELYFDKTFWPEFRRRHLYDAIREFQHRERRFGMTTKQIKTKNT
ncbi:MAG: isoprenyl transferase [Chlorobi bacterium]|nr:isoprenyl transferase [Chlorobiota bacterium]MCI0715539.1 isoprenyl transferase [Chlorobiota bacterium]